MEKPIKSNVRDALERVIYHDTCARCGRRLKNAHEFPAKSGEFYGRTCVGKMREAKHEIKTKEEAKS